MRAIHMRLAYNGLKQLLVEFQAIGRSGCADELVVCIHDGCHSGLPVEAHHVGSLLDRLQLSADRPRRAERDKIEA